MFNYIIIYYTDIFYWYYYINYISVSLLILYHYNSLLYHLWSHLQNYIFIFLYLYLLLSLSFLYIIISLLFPVLYLFLFHFDTSGYIFIIIIYTNISLISLLYIIHTPRYYSLNIIIPYYTSIYYLTSRIVSIISPIFAKRASYLYDIMIN
jgi:hypothetical protein